MLSSPGSDSMSASQHSDPPLVPADGLPSANVSTGTAPLAASIVAQPHPGRASTVTSIEAAVDEAELQRTLSTHEEQQRNRERKDSDIALMYAMGRELDEWASGAAGLNTDEYFDVRQFTQSAESCWGERRASDAAATSKANLRLFPSESAILAQRELRERLQQERSLQDEHELSLRHPLLYRRMKQNKERRELFKTALIEHKSQIGASAVPGLTSTGTLALYAPSPINGGYSPLRDMNPPRPFAKVASFNSSKHAELVKQQERRASSKTEGLLAIAGAEQLASETAAALESPSQGGAAPACGSPSSKSGLAALLREQRALLENAARHDEEVYQPILRACYEYERHAHAKLSQLSGIHDTPRDTTQTSA